MFFFQIHEHQLYKNAFKISGSEFLWKFFKDTILWHGSTCHRIKHHGDFCHDQIECSISGDPHLQCVKEGDVSRCLCSSQYDFKIYPNGQQKCVQKNFSVNKMSPKPNDGMVTLPETGGRIGFQ